ncbi:hypothetical protein GOP47_0015186 [Adiantum capillus-veneris]|uniref:Pentatricopeptide repeat-containing protein n=1 Tax=Adiantum capillus-veneris TaxID=13818 RepID=A0A9D4UMV8_ADICA|nr:hypothetical protein GOP47_0015186 [Adiantum capillus-veneris]
MSALPPRRPFISGEAICNCLQECLRTKNVAAARPAHSEVIVAALDAIPEFRDLLIQVYAHGGSLAEAHSVFARTSKPTSHTWHAIISAHVKLGEPRKAISLYQAMSKQGSTANKWIFLCIIKACSNLQLFEQGLHVHIHIIHFGLDSDIVLSTTLVDMYAKCGHLEAAHKVFSGCPCADSVLWGALISGYVQQGEDFIALELFADMQDKGHNPDRFVYSCILKAFGNIRAVRQGMEIHNEILLCRYEWDKVIGSTLVDTYAKCGALEEARKVFDSLPDRDNVLWGSMIAGYAQHTHGIEALELFIRCLKQGTRPDKVMYTSALKACASVVDPSYGRLLHELFIKTGLDQNEAIGNALVDMYSNWKSLKDAQKVFEEMRVRSVVTWNTMIATYADHGHVDSSMELFKRMQSEGTTLDSVSVANTLKACSIACTLEEGRFVHDHVIKISFESGRMVGNTLIDMYAKCGSLEEACAVFDGMANKDVVSWNTIIMGCLQCGHARFAMTLFTGMHDTGLHPDAFTLSSIAKACIDVGEMEECFLAHFVTLECNDALDVSVGHALLDMYCKVGLIVEANKLFDLLPNKNVVTWNLMIGGYAHQGLALSALQTFENMGQKGLVPDDVTFLSALKACGMLGVALEGRLIHCQVIMRRHESDTVFANSLVDMYIKCGSRSEAQCIFDSLKYKDVVSWNTMIAGLSQLADGQKVLDLFQKMQFAGVHPDEVTFSSVIKACTVCKMMKQGQHFHIKVVKLGLESHPVVNGALLDLYVTVGFLEEAQKVLQSLSSSNIVSLNEMVAGYVKHGFTCPALQILKDMQGDGLQPDMITYSSILKACNSREALEQGRIIHGQMTRSETELDEVAGSTLIGMYAKCGSLTEARQVFDDWPNRDRVMWSAMIGGYVQDNHFLPALELFSAFLQEHLQPDEVMLSSVLKACCCVGAFGHGLVLHDLIMRWGFQSDPSLRSSLIDMYGKLGRLQEASNVFLGSQSYTLESWTSMIAGYAQQGEHEWAQRFMDAMQQQGCRPDGKTYVSILTGCSHAAKVAEGEQHLRSMGEDHGLIPSIHHFNCLVDLLGRAGRLDEAEQILQTVPLADVVAGWVSLLTACKTFGDNTLAKHCFRQLAQWSAAGTEDSILISNNEDSLCFQNNSQNLHDLQACKILGVCTESDKSLRNIELARGDVKTERVVNGDTYAAPLLRAFEHKQGNMYEDSSVVYNCLNKAD